MVTSQVRVRPSYGAGCPADERVGSRRAPRASVSCRRTCPDGARVC